MLLHVADCAETTHFLLQGLADAFILLGMPFDSAEAKQLNKEIFEAIYFSALETSCALAQIDGARLLFPPALGSPRAWSAFVAEVALVTFLQEQVGVGNSAVLQEFSLL